MKLLFAHTILLFVFFQTLNAQDKQLADSTSFSIPTLTDVLNAALQNSPLLKSKEIAKEIAGQEVKIEKKKWMDYVSISGSVNYGLTDQVIISGLTTAGATSTGLLNTSEQLRYSTGFGINLPISGLFNRRSGLNIKKMSRQKSDYEMQQAQEDLRQIIIEEYYKLKYLEESMKTFQGIYETMQIGHMKVEKDLLSGRIEMNDYALKTSAFGKSKDEYLKTKYNFFAQYYKLQDLTGVMFNSK